MTDEQLTPCPRCGSTASVHSIRELADLARMQLSQGQPGFTAGLPQGYAPPAGPVPGYAQAPQTGPVNPPLQRTDWDDRPAGGVGQAVADATVGLAGRGFVGRAINRRVQATMNDRILPALAERQHAMLTQQIAIAERYPGLCACLADSVIFLAGGSRVVPMPNLATITLQQADALVGQLGQD